ncbi:hypothetical protein D9M70_601210 [compost metagenome]
MRRRAAGKITDGAWERGEYAVGEPAYFSRAAVVVFQPVQTLRQLNVRILMPLMVWIVGRCRGRSAGAERK